MGSEVDIIVEGGTVVTESGRTCCDIAIRDGRVAGLFLPGTAPPAKRVIDAQGKFVLPGLVDAHTHLQIHFGGVAYRDDYYTGSVAAAFNGTTTIIDFVFPGPGEELAAAIDKEMRLADGSCVVDFGFHPCILPSTPRIARAVREAVDAGLTSFKLFMTYGRHGLMIDDGHLLSVMEAACETGALAGVHAENDAIAEHLTTSLCRGGAIGPESFPKSKPSFVEVEAIRRATFLAGSVGCALYVFHMSTAGGAREIRTARSAGQRVFAETCPHYLLLDSEVYAGPDGARFIVSPPLRPKHEQDALWEGLADGTISVVATDHAPLNSDQKAQAKSFAEVPNGLAGIELSLPLLYTCGVLGKRITLENLVSRMSSGPARLFGLYPRKGAILPGSDADLVVIDPKVKKTVRAGGLHMNVDHVVYEGMELCGWPEVTLLRGQTLVRNGTFCGRKGYGTFLRRSLPAFGLPIGTP